MTCLALYTEDADKYYTGVVQCTLYSVEYPERLAHTIYPSREGGREGGAHPNVMPLSTGEEVW